MNATVNGHPVLSPSARHGDTALADSGRPADVVFLAPPDARPWEPPDPRLVAVPVVQPGQLQRQEPPLAAGNEATPAPSPVQAASATQAAPRLSWLRWPDGDTVITALMALAVLAVAAFAAIQSYGHGRTLATNHSETSLEAALFMLSVDGEIMAASLVMLSAARRRLHQHWLARVNLIAGITATVGVNAAVAIPHQWISPATSAWIGIVLSAWPGQAFIGIVEMAIRHVRDIREAATRRAASDSDNDTDGDTETDADQDQGDGDNDARGDRKPLPKRRPGGKADPVTAAIKRHNAWRANGQLDAEAVAAIAARCGVSVRTVERRIGRLRAAASAKAADL
jgi:hypothetical protein